MSVKDSAANGTSKNISNIQADHTTRAADALLEPTWQLQALKVEFYFQYALIAIGIFGTAANALVLYALISHNAGHAKKRAVNLLIINQNFIDLVCCILLVVTFSARVSNIYLTGTVGYLICTILTSETANFCAVNASVISLMCVTVERYLKVVHPFWSKKNLKLRMIHGAMVFAWVGGILSIGPVGFATTVVQDGVCLSYLMWISSTARISYSYWNLFSFGLIPTILFIFCYGRIMLVMRRQMRVMAGHGNTTGSAQTNASQIKNKRIKWNIMKTMIIVTVVFVISWLPFTSYFLFVDYIVESDTDPSNMVFVGYNATVFLSYLSISMNPFIYAIKHEGVKEKLMSVMGCFRRNVVTVTSDAAVNARSNRGAGAQPTPTVGAQ